MAYGLSSIPNMSGGIGAGILQAGQAWGKAFSDYGKARADQQDEKFTKDLLAGITRQQQDRKAKIAAADNWDVGPESKAINKRVMEIENAKLDLIESAAEVGDNPAANPEFLMLQHKGDLLKKQITDGRINALMQSERLKLEPINYQGALDLAMANNPNVSMEAWQSGLLAVNNLQQHESSTRTMGSREKVAHNQATRSDQLVDKGFYDQGQRPINEQLKKLQLESTKRGNRIGAATEQGIIDAAKWKAKAAEMGHEATTLELQKLRESMAPMDQNLLKSIESGTLDAATMASIPPSQMQKAMSWYRVKIDLGNMKTQEKLADLKAKEGPAVQSVDIRAINTLMSEASDEVKRIDKQMDVFRNTASLAHGGDARVNSMIDSHKAEMAKLQKEMDAAKKEYKTYQQQLMWKVPSAFDGATVRFNGQLWNSTGGKWVKINQ